MSPLRRLVVIAAVAGLVAHEQRQRRFTRLVLASSSMWLSMLMDERDRNDRWATLCTQQKARIKDLEGRTP